MNTSSAGRITARSVALRCRAIRLNLGRLVRWCRRTGGWAVLAIRPAPAAVDASWVSFIVTLIDREDSRMQKLFGIYAVGVVIGISIMMALDSPVLNPDKTVGTATTSTVSELPEALAITQPVTTQNAAEMANNGLAPEAAGTALAGDASIGDNPVRIPSVYRDLVGPIPTPTISNVEKLERFENEPRDEPWAFAMETGINNHIAEFGTVGGRVVEYVECRSQQCWIAGLIDKGHQGSTGRPLNDMRRSGWWQAEGGGDSITVNTNGLTRFVLIYRRY